MKKYKIMIVLIILLVIIVFGLFVFSKSVINNRILDGIKFKNEDGSEMRIGKKLRIVIEENQIVDSDFLKSIRDGKRTAETRTVEKLTLMGDDTFNKLINYLERENLKIKPGSYDVNQAFSFNKLLEVIEFESKL